MEDNKQDKPVWKVIKVEDRFSLNLSNVSRNDNMVLLMAIENGIHYNLELIKDKKTKWYTFRLVRLDTVNHYVREKTLVNLSFDNAQEFKEKIIAVWNTGDSI